jgi:hypothetical protein
MNNYPIERAAWDTISVTDTAVADLKVIDWTVPTSEVWKIINAWISHNDVGAQTFVLTLVREGIAMIMCEPFALGPNVRHSIYADLNVKESFIIRHGDVLRLELLAMGAGKQISTHYDVEKLYGEVA